MARIRSIKPEFPHSGSMGRVSRESRLCFLQMWTLSDDVGRLRGNSRMLASLLYPYDDDAKDLIDGWLTELEREGCIQCYVVNGDNYVQICNWLTHQKIDKPSASKIPPPETKSRTVAKPREDSSGDGKGLDQGLEGIKEGSGAPASDVPRQTFLKIQGLYPAGLYRGADWQLAEREIGRRLDDGESAASLVGAAGAYAMQQSALEKTGTQFVLSPSKFYGSSGQWRGPFPTPTKPETASEKILRLNSGAKPDPRIIEHEPISLPR